MEDLRISLIQTSLHWENVDANLQLFDEKLACIQQNFTDLIVLPEMFTTGFTMKATDNFEEMNGKTLHWMELKSKEKNCIVTGSFIIKENENYFNRLIWMKPDGSFFTYDKRHLFRMAKEDETYTPGNNKLIVELKGWRICPLICYDLRFPVWSRNKNDYDVLIYVANWPERRVFAWKQLLIARAIENQSYVIGVNRIGEDGNGIIYSGDSVTLDYMGTKISSIKPHQDTTETINLSYKKLEEYRQLFPAYRDSDGFDII